MHYSRRYLVVASIYLASLIFGSAVLAQGRMGSFTFDLTPETVYTSVCTDYDLTIRLGNTGSEVSISNLRVWVLFKDYGTGANSAEVADTTFSWSLYDGDDVLQDSGTGTGTVGSVAAASQINPNFPAGTYGAFMMGLPEDLPGGWYLVLCFPIHSSEAGTVKLLSYAYGEDTSETGVVHNSLEKYLDEDWWALSSDELSQSGNQKGIAVTIEDYQEWTVPALSAIALPTGFLALGLLLRRRRN